MTITNQLSNHTSNHNSRNIARSGMDQGQMDGVAEEFYKAYYDHVDKRRHLLSKLYMDEAIVVWNGIPMNTAESIAKFYEEYPPTTHKIVSVDIQPFPEFVVQDRKAFIIQISGNVLIEKEKDSKPFHQVFLITAVGNKWKIASDTFRWQQINL